MNRQGRQQRQSASPTPILLEPPLDLKSAHSGDAWPQHEAPQNSHGRRAASPCKENVWVPAGRAGAGVQVQKEDAENQENSKFLKHIDGRGSPKSLRELVGNSTPALQIHITSPGKAREAQPAIGPAGQSKDGGAERLEESGAMLPVFAEFRLPSARRGGTPEMGAVRGSASLARPLSSGRIIFGGSRPVSRQDGLRPSTERSDFGRGLPSLDAKKQLKSARVADGLRAELGRNMDRVPANSGRILADSEPDSDTDLDREVAEGFRRRPNTRRTPEFVSGRNTSDSQESSLGGPSPETLPPYSRRNTSPLVRSRSSPHRARSAVNIYPISLEQCPTSRWAIDSETDSAFDENLARIASLVRRSRPATSLGLAPKAQSARGSPHPGMHSSEIWGSLNERARKVAAESAEELQKRRRRRSSPEKHSEGFAPKVRASSAPLWNPRVTRHRPDAAPANGDAPGGRQSSLWAFHPPADQALRNARSAAAARLRQDIELYRENSFQREMLQQRVDSHREEALQQRRQLVEATGDLLERNKSNLEQHRAEERNRRILERAQAHQERWTAIVERHVDNQRREEDARDELILLLSKEEEEDRKAEAKERLRLFKIERRRWWTTLVALGGRLQLLAETVKAQREIRLREQRRLAAALYIQDWFRRVRKVLIWKRQNAAARKIQRFTRDVVFAQKDRRRKRYAGLIAMFLGDLQRSQALMLAFRTFRQRVMTIQRVVVLRTLRIRAQVSLVLRQWEVAEENWIKTHELAELQATTKTPARSRRVTRASGAAAVAAADGPRSAASSDPDTRRSNTGDGARASVVPPEPDGKRKSVQIADGRRSTISGNMPSADVRRASAAPVSKLPSSRTSIADKTLGRIPVKGKPAKVDPGERHRALFDLRDGVLGPEYVSSGVHVPPHIQEQVTKDFCMRKRRAHVKVLEAYKLERAEQQRAARDGEMMARAKLVMQGKGTARKGAESAPVEAKRPAFPPRLRVLATRQELHEMMVEGLAKAAIEGLAANLPGDSLPVSESGTPLVGSTPAGSKRSSGGSRRGTREAQVAAPVRTAPGGSRRGTREVTMMAAIHEAADGDSARAVPMVLNLAGAALESGGTTRTRRAGRQGTNSKKVVTWGTEASGASHSTVPEEEAPS
ncbi:hypothetical protein KFL_005430030 [Klebsormidium nitens]|uniref:Uncharacterized protein n=1 Tax=Klebsormidium nitens TaxID=105231 RepID=A0A1Y1INC4_KLENI|nr:hypothetical protein KFL_005430030 [Klebsormidium nitens]|eukprot:GAQ89618.1 hypothetical protein KFL_005430030 [Klebsormidium nitens]